MHGGRAAPAIGEAGGVAHQVLQRDRSRGGHRLDRPLTGKHALAEYRDPPVAELRQEALDRVGQPEASCFPQHQSGHAGDGLGHGRNGEQSVAWHRGALVRAEMANGLVKHQMPPPGNRNDRARQSASLDLGVQRRDDPSEPRGGHADRFRLGYRQGSADGCGGRRFGCGGYGHVAAPDPGGALARGFRAKPVGRRRAGQSRQTRSDDAGRVTDWDDGWPAYRDVTGM